MQGAPQQGPGSSGAPAIGIAINLQTDSAGDEGVAASESGVAALLQQSYGQSDSGSGNSQQVSFDGGVTSISRFGFSDSSTMNSQVNYALMTKPGVMWNELDQQLGNIESQIHGDLIVVGAAGAAASSFTVGVVAWGLRTGFLASGMLAQLPAWRAVDPLLIMQGSGEGDDESLEDLMKRRSQDLDNKSLDHKSPDHADLPNETEAGTRVS